MNKINLPVGTAGFESIRENGYYYIDKTRLISELIRDSATSLLFTRPRRFGKTTVMTMLSSFFDIQKNSEALFSGLSVMEDMEAVNNWMNKYPVIYISFKDVSGLGFPDALAMLGAELYRLFQKYPLFKSVEFSEGDRRLLNDIFSGNPSAISIKKSLSSLVWMLSNYYGRKVIILIDEYDVPLAYSEQNGYYDEMLDVIRSMFSVLKDNEKVEKAVLTGCLKISKESLFTGLNNLASYSLLSKKYASYFGFTDTEVDSLLSAAALADKKDVIANWYDGYQIGGVSIFSSWDVISYVNDLQSDCNALPRNYWANTSSNSIIRKFIELTNASIADEYSSLISGNVIYKQISENVTYNDLYSSIDNVWSLMFETGYLTLSGEYDENNLSPLRIPNEEIRNLFINTVNRWFDDSIRKEDRTKLFSALFSGDENALSELITDCLEETISYYDYSEEFYHAFVAGLFSSVNYYVKSNREAGTGRYDLLVADRKNKKIAILEFKAVKKEADIQKTLNKALVQIDEKAYDFDFKRYSLLRYAVVFFKKSASVLLKKDE